MLQLILLHSPYLKWKVKCIALWDTAFWHQSIRIRRSFWEATHIYVINSVLICQSVTQVLILFRHWIKWFSSHFNWFGKSNLSFTENWTWEYVSVTLIWISTTLRLLSQPELENNVYPWNTRGYKGMVHVCLAVATVFLLTWFRSRKFFFFPLLLMGRP